ncbi:MAG TPA: hypothetical protein VFU02_13260 [Polyangiaceae bacterium]|nr:hypothetical protein [Polyangiaceae bacterium]
MYWLSPGQSSGPLQAQSSIGTHSPQQLPSTAGTCIAGHIGGATRQKEPRGTQETAASGLPEAPPSPLPEVPPEPPAEPVVSTGIVVLTVSVVAAPPAPFAPPVLAAAALSSVVDAEL